MRDGVASNCKRIHVMSRLLSYYPRAAPSSLVRRLCVLLPYTISGVSSLLGPASTIAKAAAYSAAASLRAACACALRAAASAAAISPGASALDARCAAARARAAASEAAAAAATALCAAASAASAASAALRACVADHRSCAALRCGSFGGRYGSPSACAAECDSRSGDGRCAASAAALAAGLLPPSSSDAAGRCLALPPMSHSSGELTVRNTRTSPLQRKAENVSNQQEHPADSGATHPAATPPRPLLKRLNVHGTAKQSDAASVPVRRRLATPGRAAHLLRRRCARRPYPCAATSRPRCLLSSARRRRSARASRATAKRLASSCAAATRRRCGAATGQSGARRREISAAGASALALLRCAARRNMTRVAPRHEPQQTCGPLAPELLRSRPHGGRGATAAQPCERRL